MAEDCQDRVAELERQLSAAQRTIEALIHRAERQAQVDPAGRVAVRRAMHSLEDAVTLRNRALQLSEAHFRTIWNESPDMLVTIDGRGQILDRNRRAAEARLVGRLCENFIDHDEAARACMEGGQSQMIDGRSVHLAKARIADTPGVVDLVVIRDLSVHQLLENELQHGRRLALLGELAKSVSHEVNNPLSVILGRLELVEALGEDVDAVQIQRHLDVVADHARRIGLIVANLDVVARPGPGRQQDLELAALIREAAVACGRRLERVSLEVDLPTRGLRLKGDGVQLRQMLTSLLINGADSMNRRGSLKVTARLDGRFVSIDVEDGGGGVPPAVAERIRQPWALGSTARSGSALGMAVAASIVRAHGGRLRVVESSSRGSTYRVELPRDPNVLGSGARVDLVVIDPRTQEIGELISLLGALAHQVRYCRTWAEAVESIEARAPDVVVCSRFLPGLDQETTEVLAARWPELSERVLVFVGAMEAPPMNRARVLSSPLSALDVLETLEELIGR